MNRKRTGTELLCANKAIARQFPSKYPESFQQCIAFHGSGAEVRDQVVHEERYKRGGNYEQSE
jgi:hypothetical protein